MGKKNDGTEGWTDKYDKKEQNCTRSKKKRDARTITTTNNEHRKDS